MTSPMKTFADTGLVLLIQDSGMYPYFCKNIENTPYYIAGNFNNYQSIDSVCITCMKSYKIDSLWTGIQMSSNYYKL